MNAPLIYVNNNSFQRTTVNDLLEQYQHLLRWNGNNSRILDIGCGPGDLTRDVSLKFIPNNWKEVVGVDISKEMVDYAREKYAANRMSFKILDIGGDDVPKSLMGFDNVFSFFCLNWVQNQSNAFRNMYKMCKNGGQICLMFVTNSTLYDVFIAMKNNNKWKRYTKSKSNHLSPYHGVKNIRKMIQKQLEAVGFEGEVIGLTRFVQNCGNIDEYLKITSPLDTTFQNIPKLLQEDYIEDFINITKKNNMVEIDENNGENVAIHLDIVVVVANKPL